MPQGAGAQADCYFFTEFRVLFLFTQQIQALKSLWLERPNIAEKFIQRAFFLHPTPGFSRQHVVSHNFPICSGSVHLRPHFIPLTRPPVGKTAFLECNVTVVNWMTSVLMSSWKNQLKRAMLITKLKFFSTMYVSCLSLKYCRFSIKSKLKRIAQNSKRMINKSIFTRYFCSQLVLQPYACFYIMSSFTSYNSCNIRNFSFNYVIGIQLKTTKLVQQRLLYFNQQTDQTDCLHGFTSTQSYLFWTKLWIVLSNFSGSALDDRIAEHCDDHNKQEVAGVHKVQINEGAVVLSVKK